MAQQQLFHHFNQKTVINDSTDTANENDEDVDDMNENDDSDAGTDGKSLPRESSSKMIDLEVNELKLGLSFPSEEVATASIENWTYKTFCPLIKARYRKGKTGDDGERIKGRRCFACPHSVVRNGKTTGKRPSQRVKYTGCNVKVTINEQEDGDWVVTTCNLDHEGHPVTAKAFFSHQHNKKLEPEDVDFVKGLMRAKANPRNIANVLTEKTGKIFETQTV